MVGRLVKSAVVCVVWLGVIVQLTWAIPPFTEEALPRGIAYTAMYLNDVGTAGQSQGAAFADLDLDGDADLILIGSADGVVGVYANDGSGHFTAQSDTGMPILDHASSVTAVDYDGDGDLDVFLTQFNDFVLPQPSGQQYLLRNDGDFTFTDVTQAAGLLDLGSSTGATWGDYDGDGFLDVYIPNYGGPWDPTPNRLYRNLGDGTFEEVASELGVDDPGGEGFQASFVDYDLDGDVDLFNVNDRGLQTLVGNSLWRNNGDGTFTEVSEADSTGMLMFAMGLAIGDMDRNGWPDFYVTNITDNVLLMNLDGETFVDMADEYGVRSGTIGWGAMWFDMDNDGWLELYVCNAPPPGSQDVADRLYQCNHPCDAGSAPCCVDLAASLGLNVLSTSYGVTSADIDDDGDVDLLVVRPGGTIPEPPDGDFRVLLYINHADAAPNHWLKVRLAGPGTAFAPIGATVFVQDAIGWQQQSLVAGKCYKSQTSTDLHFGVGAVTLVSELKVLWPGGGETVIPNVPVDQTLVVAETAPPAPFVTGVTLAGPTTVADATTVTYTATATCPCQYTTGGDVTAAAVWSAAPPEYASFDASAPGVLVVHDVVGSQAVDISATVGSVTATMTVVIHDSAPPPSDTTPPVVVITTPTADSAMSTDEAVVTLGGTAWDDVGVTSVTWRTDAGAGGSCSGRTSWTSSAIPLLPGDNVITVTATDAAQHVGQDTLAVAYVPAAVLSVARSGF